MLAQIKFILLKKRKKGNIIAIVTLESIALFQIISASISKIKQNTAKLIQ